MIDAFEDDDDFFDVVFSEETEKILLQVENVHSRPASYLIFDCSGETNAEKVSLSRNGYLQDYDTLFIEQDDNTVSCITLFGRTVDKGSALQLYCNDFFSLAAKDFMQLDAAARVTFGSSSFATLVTNKSYFEERKRLVDFFHFLLIYVNKLRDKRYRSLLYPSLAKISIKLRGFDRLLGSLRDLPDHVRQFCSNSSGNKCSQASFHFMHAHLDLRWLHLLVVHSISLAKVEAEGSPCHVFKSQDVSDLCEKLIRYLSDLAILRFNKFELQDITKKTPFGCTCVQELWLVLQKFVTMREKEGGKSFWGIIDNLVNAPSNKTNDDESDDEETIPPYNVTLFSVWFLLHLGRLCHYNKCETNDYQLLEAVLKQAVSKDAKEAELRVIMNLVERICIDLWEPKTEPILILWEYYQKRLNDSFYIPGHKLDSCSVITKDGQGLLDRVRNLLADQNTPGNSYESFLRIIGLHLQKSTGNPRHWNLIKGRVYSKVTLPRLMGLTQTGEHHAICLLVLLALCGNVQEVSSRVSELLEGCLNSKGISEELLKGGLAIALLLAERNSPLHNIAPVLVSAVQTPTGESLAPMLVSALADLVDAPLGLGQHLFFDKWLSIQMSSDSSRLLDVILSLTNSMASSEPCHDHIILLEKLWPPLNSYITFHVINSSTPVVVADVCLNLAVCFHNLSETARFNEIVSVFLHNDSCNIRLARRFVCNFLDSNIRSCLPSISDIVMKIWVRSALVCQDMNHEEIKRLSLEVSQMPHIQALCYGKVSEIAESEEPLLEFVMSINAKFESIKDIFQKQKLREKVSLYFAGIDSWVKGLITPPEINLDLTERVYFLIGNIVRLISPLLYLKSKPNNILVSLLNITLLPLSVHNPEFKMHSFVVSATRKTSHLFIEGLLKLNPQSDPYINRSIREIITVYVPRCLANSGAVPARFQISSFSLITLFNKFSSDMMKTVLSVLCDVFLKSKSRKAHQNAIQVLLYIREVLRLHSADDRVLLAIIHLSFSPIITTAVFCDEKGNVNSAAKELVAALCQSISKSKSEAVKDAAVGILGKFSKENLAWNSRQVFEIICFMANHSPELIKRFSQTFLKIIQEVESLRGVGYDKLLRLGYERVQSKVMSVKENLV